MILKLRILFILASVLFFGNESNAQIKKLTHVEVNDTTIIFNHKIAINLSVSPEKLIEIFGKPRGDLKDTADTIYYWDHLGLLAYKESKSNTIHAIDLCYNHGDIIIQTKSFYKGEFVVNEKNVPQTITLDSFYSIFQVGDDETVKDMPSIYNKTYEILFEFDEKSGVFIGVEILKSDK